MRVHIIQHVPFEGPGAIGGWARERGHATTLTEQWTGAGLPGPDDFDFLVIMGGPMSANDEAEFRLAGAGEKADRPDAPGAETVLGVCLGAQLLAPFWAREFTGTGKKRLDGFR